MPVRVFSKDKVLRRILRKERFVEGAWKVLRRQKNVLSQSTTPFACTPRSTCKSHVHLHLVIRRPSRVDASQDGKGWTRQGRNKYTPPLWKLFRFQCLRPLGCMPLLLFPKDTVHTIVFYFETSGSGDQQGEDGGGVFYFVSLGRS